MTASRKTAILLCTLYSVLCTPVFARTARIYGYVVDQDNIGIELANVAAATSAFSAGDINFKSLISESCEAFLFSRRERRGRRECVGVERLKS